MEKNNLLAGSVDIIDQLKKYAADLAELYKSEKQKSEGLQAANQQLVKYADDLATIYESLRGSKERFRALQRLLADQWWDQKEVLIGRTRVMKELQTAMEQPVDDAVCVLIQGETGVGKKLIAQILHGHSARARQPFIMVDGQQFAEDQWGEHLFGSRPAPGLMHLPRHYGYFELAEGGTLLIKDVNLMSLEVQVRLRELLDAREARQARKEGGYVPDVLMMATCREDLYPKVECGEFDSRLAEHLSKRRIVVPPIRARKRDIPDLVQHFVTKHVQRLQKPIRGVHQDVMQRLLAYDFLLGNVKELEECIERAIILSDQEEIGLEHLFLQVPRRQEGLSYNLLQWPRLRKFLKMDVWPTAVQVLTVLFFIGILVLLFARPAGKGHWGLDLVWSVWWPMLFVSFMLLGRIWCAVCPIGALTYVIQHMKHWNKSPPTLLKKYDYLFITAGFMLIMWVEGVTAMRESMLATGLLLMVILCGAVAVNTLYERATWCRYLCPLGGMAGVCSITALLELRPNIDVCSNQCITHTCYKGTETIAGCPLFQHVMFVNTNQHCKLCMNCVRVCPHDSVQLNLRLPAQEIWIAPEATKIGFYLFAATMLGIFFPVYVHEIQGEEAFRGSVLLFTIVFLGAAAASVGFFRLTGWFFVHGKDFSVQNLWQQVTYAYLPLVVGVYTSYMFRLIEQLQTYHLRLFPVTGGSFVLQVPVFYPFIMLFIGTGLLLSFYSVYHMLHHVRSLSAARRTSFLVVHMITQTIYASLALTVMLGM